MVDILDRIPHPFVRSATAAVMGASAATIISGGLLGLTPLDNTLVHRLSLALGIAGAGLGAVMGGLIKPLPPAAHTHIPRTAPSPNWTDWRNFVVVHKIPESQEITSFYLKPQDEQAIPGFLPGQFLTLKLDIPGQSRPVIRTYSLSAYTPEPESYRLSIKREGAPPDQAVPPGVASNFLHDHVQEGTVIACKPPAGKFVLDTHSDRPVVLISNGVGITPMVSMAQAATLAHPQRPVWFLHGARDGSLHAFREAVLAIAPQHPNFIVHYRYSRPRPEDEGKYHSTGYVDTALVQSLLMPDYGPTDAAYFLCGSPSFMDSLRLGLAAWGVPDAHVFFESFAKPLPPVQAPAAAGDVVESAEVVFARSGKTATWSAGAGTLLEFAEDQGLSPDFSCRAGICLTCMCRLEAGEVVYNEPPTGTPEAGQVLICVSQPGTDRVVLDL